MHAVLQLTPTRFPLYLLVNFAFMLLVAAASAVGGSPNPRWLYLILIFALCSHPLIDFDRLNGRYALLALFMFVYFVTYGALDLSHILFGEEVVGASSPLGHSILSQAEGVILAGGVMLVLGYRIAVYLADSLPQRRVWDWPKSTILVIGLILWAVGTAVTYHWNAYIVTDTTVEAERRGLASLSPTVLTLYQLGQYSQPLGLLLLTYAWTVFPGMYTLSVMTIAVILQVLLGFVIDVKGQAMLGIILLIVAGVLVHARIPKIWLAVGVLFVIFVYPLLASYRVVVHGSGISRTAVVQNFGEALRKTIASEDRVNSGRYRAQTFLERSSIKQNVEVIVAKAGDTVPFQYGHTLSPILFAFVPKILWAGKDQIETGRLLNREFHFTESDNEFISPSHLGELYWNFGWTGVIVGMCLIGLACGWVGARFNLAEFRTVTRALILIVTIKQVIVGFEGSVSDIYVVWLRSLAGIGILHLIFARSAVTARMAISGRAESLAQSQAAVRSERLYPNLLT